LAEEDDRIVVGERDATAAERLRCARDGFRRGGFGQHFHLAGVADVPVLAKFTGQITAGGTE
jgi:hypothetical protein